MRATMISALVVLVGLTLAVLGWAQVCTPPPSGMVAWWPGDGNANSIIGSNNGTLQGGVTFAPGKVAQAFSLNGVDGFVDVPDNPTLHLPGSLSMDVWINGTAFGPINTILSKPNVSINSTNFNFHVIGGKLFFAITFDQSATLASGTGGCDPGGCFVTGATAITTGAFHLVAGVYDDTSKTMSVYLDGLLDGTATFNTSGHPLSNTADVAIGARGGVSSFFDGLLDEVELFNRALTPAEITAVFAAGSAGKCKPSQTCPSQTCREANGDDVEGDGDERGDDGHTGHFHFCKRTGEMDFEEQDSGKGMKGRMDSVTFSGNSATITGSGTLLDGTPVNYTAVALGNANPAIGADTFAISWISSAGSSFHTSGALADGNIIVVHLQ